MQSEKAGRLADEPADDPSSTKKIVLHSTRDRKEKSPAFNLDAERAVLGAILLDSGCIEVAASVVGPEDFTRAHRPIFSRALELFQAGQIVDPVLLINALRKAGELEDVGGPAYVCALTDGMPRSANVHAYAELVRKAAVRRGAIESIKKAAQKAGTGDGDITGVIDRLISELEKIERVRALGFQPPTHWRLLDVSTVREWECEPLQWIVEHIFARGTLAFIAADSQVGKTLLMLYVALMMTRGGSLFDRFPVTPADHILYLALEDPDRRAKKRIIDSDRQGNFTPPGAFQVYVAPGLRLNDPLCLDWLVEYIETGKHDVVIIDTFQKGTPGLLSWDDEKIGPILHRLQDLARRLNALIIILDHLAKPKDGKPRRTISITDIKGSGGKAQNADTVILMDRVKSDQISVRVSCKDSDKKPAFLLRISPEGEQNEEKFVYEGDLEGMARTSKEQGEASRQKVREAIMDWRTRDQLEDSLGMSRSTVAKHLKQLDKADQLEQRRRGRQIEYKAIVHSGTHSNILPRTNQVNS